MKISIGKNVKMVVSLDFFITKVLLHVNFILFSFLSGNYQTTFEFFHERDVLEKIP